MLQSAGLKAGPPVRSAGLGRKKLGGAGLKNGGFGRILRDFGGFRAVYRAAGALPEISEHTRSRIFICPLRYIDIYITRVMLFDGLGEIGAPDVGS